MPENLYDLGNMSALRFRPGTRFCAPMIPLPLYELIGQVAVYWGGFEQKMNGLLSAFVAADSDPYDEGWQRSSFRQRQRMLRKKATNHFPGPIANEIKSILGAARVYHWQRNLIVHGQTHAQFVDGIGTPVAKGNHNGRYLALPLTPDFLERMYAELGFLTGRLEDLTCEDESGCNLAFSDRSTLRAFVSTNRPPDPTPRNVSPQHPA